MSDKYITIAYPSKGNYKEKGSKFIAFAYPIFSEGEFKKRLEQLKKEYNDARHFCYAFKLGLTENEFRYSDDGEPNNSAGSPIFGQIRSFQLTNVAIIVVRYFGGTKLGVGGLISSYKQAAQEALNNANIIEKTIDNFYSVEFKYSVLSDVMNFIKKNSIQIISQELEEIGIIEFRIRQSESEKIISQLEKTKNLSLKFLKTA